MVLWISFFRDYDIEKSFLDGPAHGRQLWTILYLFYFGYLSRITLKIL